MSRPTTDPIERASRLRREADLVLQEVKLHEMLGIHGRVVPTGSYFLDLMIYPDIDVYLPSISITEVFDIGEQLAQTDLVYQVVFEKSRTPELPGGLYLKARFDYGDWGRPWKIDIWSIEEAIIGAKMAEMQRFKEKMTRRLRERILRYKHSILTGENRTPTYSGYFICRAFIDEGMSNHQEVTQYLLDHGIQMI